MVLIRSVLRKKTVVRKELTPERIWRIAFRKKIPVPLRIVFRKFCLEKIGCGKECLQNCAGKKCLYSITEGRLQIRVFKSVFVFDYGCSSRFNQKLMLLVQKRIRVQKNIGSFRVLTSDSLWLFRQFVLIKDYFKRFYLKLGLCLYMKTIIPVSETG